MFSQYLCTMVIMLSCLSGGLNEKNKILLELFRSLEWSLSFKLTSMTGPLSGKISKILERGEGGKERGH